MTQLARQNTFSLALNSLSEVKEYSELLAKSTMVPKNYQNRAGDILVAIQMGAELGLKPIQALQNIAVINGKPSVYGDALLALVQTNPLCEYINESFDEASNTAICAVKRKGEQEYIVRFSKQDAEKAGLWGRTVPWKQYPKRMLQMRARGFALRDKFADVLGGLITVEEAQDYPVDVTPQAQVHKQDLSSKLDNILLQNSQSEHKEEIEVAIPNNEVQVEKAQVEESAQGDSSELAQLVITHNVPSDTIEKWCAKAQVSRLEELPEDKRLNCISHILKNYE